MPPRKAAAKKPPKKASAKEAASKKPRAKGILMVKKKQAPGSPATAKAAAGEEKPARASKKAPAQTRAPVERTRVVVPMDLYEPHKDEVKAPLKSEALKWTFLGEGKGLYKREDGGVHCFTQFKDDGVHYSIWGADKAAVERILAAWRKLLGEPLWVKATERGVQAVAQEKAQEGTEALRVWRLAEPQRRPGEPDLFFQKRVAEWQAKKPA